MSTLYQTAITNPSSLSKSQRRRIRAKKLTGTFVPIVKSSAPAVPVSVPVSASELTSATVFVTAKRAGCKSVPPADQQQEEKVPSGRYNNTTVLTGQGLVSTLVIDPIVAKPTFEQRCINHVQYVYNTLAQYKNNEDYRLEAMQDHPEMYFRKRYICRAVRLPYDPKMLHKPSLTESECIEHCIRLFKAFEVNPHSYNDEGLQAKVPNLNYRKQIIRKAREAFSIHTTATLNALCQPELTRSDDESLVALCAPAQLQPDQSFRLSSEDLQQMMSSEFISLTGLNKTNIYHKHRANVAVDALATGEQIQRAT